MRGYMYNNKHQEYTEQRNALIPEAEAEVERLAKEYHAKHKPAMASDKLRTRWFADTMQRLAFERGLVASGPAPCTIPDAPVKE